MKLLLSFALLAVSGLLVAGDPLNVNIHYRAYCLYCQIFFNEQFLPTMQTLGDEVDGLNLNIKILPIFHENDVDGELVFTCNGGDEECKAETYASCVLGKEYSLLQKALFMNCTETSSDSADVANIKTCAEKAKIDYDDVSKCYEEGEGLEIMKQSYETEHSYDKNITLVPYVVFNGVVDTAADALARAHFLPTLCSYLTEKPKACSQN